MSKSDTDALNAAEMRDLIEACERALADAERIIESRTGRGSWVGSLVLARVRESQAASRCEATSPIYKFDEGPRQCRLEAGHSGPHWAMTSDGRHVDPQFDYAVTWEDEARV